MASPASPPSGAGIVRALLAVLLLAAWVVLVVRTAAAGGRGVGPALWLAPLGFLGVFAFADRGLRLTRALLVALPAFVLGLAGAGVALWWRERAAGPPGPSDLLLPAIAVALGVACGLAWRRGPLALLFLPFKLVAGALAFGLLTAGVLVATLDKEPLVPEPSPSTEARGRLPTDPLAAGCLAPERAEGESRALRLSATDLERLLARTVPPLARSDRLRAAVRPGDDGRLRVLVSAHAPWIPRWLNADASARVTVRGGRLALDEARLRLARFEPRPAPMRLLASLAALAVQAERPVRRVMPAINELHIEAGQLVVHCADARPQPGP